MKFHQIPIASLFRSSGVRALNVNILYTLWLVSCMCALYNYCDVITERVAYGGTYMIGPCQTPRVMRDVESGPMIFVAHEHLQKLFCHTLCSVNHKNISQTRDNS